MGKTVAMIPARMGSQRVKFKNLRLLDGKPLIAHTIENCKNAGIFDEIYVNSEADSIGKVATQWGVRHYKRSEYLSSNVATNDEFALDFLNQIECETLIQVNPTGPFLGPSEIRGFVIAMKEGNFETYHAVKNEQIWSLYLGKPLNFDPRKKMPPSQEANPVQVFTCGIFGFNAKRFQANMAAHGCAMFGGEGTIGYHCFHGFSTLDIDREEDFLLAEAVAQALKSRSEPRYYGLELQG